MVTRCREQFFECPSRCKVDSVQVELTLHFSSLEFDEVVFNVDYEHAAKSAVLLHRCFRRLLLILPQKPLLSMPVDRST